jgi:hypothetical protein
MARSFLTFNGSYLFRVGVTSQHLVQRILGMISKDADAITSIYTSAWPDKCGGPYHTKATF